jgi:putative hydrolase of the HAD superfamily
MDSRSLPSPGDVAAWVFDLDNTLYPAASSLFPQIDRRMRSFIAERLKLEDEAAHRLQKDYYRRFGTTLRGLMLNHGIEPGAFLTYVHDIDHGVLAPWPALDAALGALPGRKLVFTNGSEGHAARVLDRLGIARHFEAVFDIVAADYVPKPEIETYRRMVERHRIDPRGAAMVEDLQRNLIPAAALGMSTVWVRQADHPDADGADGTDLSHVHHVTDDLPAWLNAVHKK